MIHVTRNIPLPVELSISRIRHMAKATLKTRALVGDMTIVFTDNDEIQQLNKTYREIDSATDVLSFPSEEIDPLTNARYLGDVIISFEKAKSQAQQNSRDVMDEISMLIVHGCLHLSGLDHLTVQEKDEMRKYQEDILSDLGIKNPSWPED